MYRTALLAVVASTLLLATTACATNGGVPTPTPISIADLDEATRTYLEDNAQAIADGFGISDPPDVQPIRLITLSEWKSTQIACLTEAGYDVTETPDGQGISYPQFTEPALRESLNLAIYTCELQYPTQLKLMTPLSTKGLEALYEYRSGELLQCLEDEGYSYSGTAPSQTVFVQSNGEWTPFAAMSIRDSDLKRVYSACPQTPDDFYDF